MNTNIEAPLAFIAILNSRHLEAAHLEIYLMSSQLWTRACASTRLPTFIVVDRQNGRCLHSM